MMLILCQFVKAIYNEKFNSLRFSKDAILVVNIYTYICISIKF